MSLATLTKTGRAAIVKSIAARDIFLAWGTGEEAWDADDAVLPSLVDITAITGEVGRRRASSVGFVTPDDAGEIVIPTASASDGTVTRARYKISEAPTPYLYVRTNFNFEDASNAVIREIGVFLDSVPADGLPGGQQYFTVDQISDPGLLLAAQIITPSIQRSPNVRQTVEFVLPI